MVEVVGGVPPRRNDLIREGYTVHPVGVLLSLPRSPTVGTCSSSAGWP